MTNQVQPVSLIHLLWIVILLFAIAVIGGLWLRLLANTSYQAAAHFSERDGVQYMCADKVLRQGKNPYDSQNMKNCQDNLGRKSTPPVMMWTHPFAAFVFHAVTQSTPPNKKAIFVSWKNFLELCYLISLFSSLLLVFVSKKKSSELVLFALIVFFALSMPAHASALYFMQISLFLACCISLATILAFQGYSTLAGVFLAPLIIKPQFLVYSPVILLALFISSQSIRTVTFLVTFRAASGLVLGLLTIFLITESQYPGSHRLWFTSLLQSSVVDGERTATSQWETASPLALLSHVLPISWTASMFLGIFLSTLFIFFLTTALLKKLGPSYKKQEWLLVLCLGILPWCFALSPYAWLYDQALLLPFLCLALIWVEGSRWLFLTLMILVHAISLLQFITPDSVQSDFMWLSFTYPLLCLYALTKTDCREQSP